MNAVAAKVDRMVGDDRIARLESDVAEIKGDVKALTTCLLEFKAEVASQIGIFRTEVASQIGTFRTEVASQISTFRTEVAKEIGSLGKEAGSFRAEVAKEFGAVRTSIERTKVWMLGTGISTVLSVAAIVWKLH